MFLSISFLIYHQNRIILFFFFFKDSAAPQNLPSFPTRRSSDLFCNSEGGGSQNLDHESPREGFHREAEKPDDRLDQRFIDRKSTRLNSSHGYISYAVFCLKKKKYKRMNSETKKMSAQTRRCTHA